jgi:hypothetical protein
LTRSLSAVETVSPKIKSAFDDGSREPSFGLFADRRRDLVLRCDQSEEWSANSSQFAVRW